MSSSARRSRRRRQPIGRLCGLHYGYARIVALENSLAGFASTVIALQTQHGPTVGFLLLVANQASNDEAITAVPWTTVSRFGRIDYSVDKAAIATPFKTTGQSLPSDFDRTLGVNLRGSWLCRAGRDGDAGPAARVGARMELQFHHRSVLNTRRRGDARRWGPSWSQDLLSDSKPLEISN